MPTTTCQHCGHTGEPVETLISERPDEFGPVTRVQLTCGRCASEDLDGVILCIDCGAAEPEAGADHCTPCLNRLLASEAEQDARVATYNRNVA